MKPIYSANQLKKNNRREDIMPILIFVFICSILMLFFDGYLLNKHATEYNPGTKIQRIR
ncbi:hypothetical protein [Microcystis phage Mel-JY01]